MGLNGAWELYGLNGFKVRERKGLEELKEYERKKEGAGERIYIM